jgi:type IV pilus assembly protein PilB
LTTAPQSDRRRRRLGELLIEAGALDESRLLAALAEQRKWGGKLGRLLVEMGFTDEPTMVRVLAQQLNLPTVDLDRATLPERIVDQLRLDLAERYGVFPLVVDASSRSLKLATSDPTNIDALQELAFATNLRLEPVVTTASAIDRAIRKYYFGDTKVAAPPSAPASQPSVSETLHQLDELLGTEPTAPPPSTPRAPSVPPSSLQHEVTLLREQVSSLEQTLVNQVRATRAMLELLLEAGLLGRDEYLAKLGGLEKEL